MSNVLSGLNDIRGYMAVKDAPLLGSSWIIKYTESG